MLEKSVAVQKMEVYGCSVKKWDNLAFWHFDEINDVRKSSKIGPHSGRILIKRCLFSIVKLLTCKSALQDYVYRSTANCDLINLLKLIGKYNAPQCLFECGRGVQLPKQRLRFFQWCFPNPYAGRTIVRRKPLFHQFHYFHIYENTRSLGAPPGPNFYLAALRAS